MKTLLIAVLAAIGMLFLAQSTGAVSIESLQKKKNIVAEYESGPHGIVGESELHEGFDVVVQKGNKGKFYQWFIGTSASEGLHGEQSKWKISKDGTCKKKEDLVEDAYPEWGDYLTPDKDYCVKTKEFHVK